MTLTGGIQAFVRQIQHGWRAEFCRNDYKSGSETNLITAPCVVRVYKMCQKITYCFYFFRQ